MKRFIYHAHTFTTQQISYHRDAFCEHNWKIQRHCKYLLHRHLGGVLRSVRRSAHGTGATGPTACRNGRGPRQPSGRNQRTNSHEGAEESDMEPIWTSASASRGSGQALRLRVRHNLGSSGSHVLGGLCPRSGRSTPKSEQSKEQKRRFRGVDATHVAAAGPTPQPRRVHLQRSLEAVHGPNLF